MTPFCANCGTRVEEDYNSCPECGSTLKEQHLDEDYSPVPVAQNPYQSQTPQYRPTYSTPRNISTQGTSGYGIASLIFGVIGLCVLGWLFGIIGIILGAIGTSRDHEPGKARAGIVLGIINLCCGIASLFLLLPLLSYPYYF